MRIVFWQNIISPHQSFFIRKLAENNDVILAVNEEISFDRITQGWKKPDTGKAQIVILNTKDFAFELLNRNEGAVHIFSGIAVYKNLKEVFNKIDKKQTIGVIVEPVSTSGWQKHIKRLLYYFKYLKYNQKIDFIFAMGNLGVDWYKSVGFPPKKIHRFQYFTELPSYQSIPSNSLNSIPNFIFIGQLIDRKNITALIRAFTHLKDEQFLLEIIGDGPLKVKLENVVKENNLENKVVFYGNLENNNAMDILAKADYLILPSKFDGWGAVINEALSRGVKVITNTNCGASCIVEEMQRGVVYRDNEENALETAIYTVLLNFKKELDSTRILAMNDFVNRYSHKIVHEFETILLNK